MPDTEEAVGRRMAIGAMWLLMMRLGVRAIGLVSTVILARLLVPEDYGVILLAGSLVAILDTMGEFSPDLVLISNQNATRSHYDTAWTLTVLRGVFVAVIIVSVAVPAGAFFDEPRISDVLYVLAISAVIGGVQNIGTVDFFKHLNLSKQFRLMVTSRVFSFIVTISMAFWWRNYWALAIGMLAESVARTFLSYWLHEFRPRFSLREWREIVHYSKWLLLSNVGDFLNERLDSLILAKFLNTQVVGLFSVAKEISNLPTSALVDPMQRAIFPGLAKMAKDRPLLVRSYIDSMAFVLMLTVPIGMGIWLTSDLIVKVLLGANWLATIPLMQILALYGVARVSYANSRAIYLSLGRPKLVAYTSIFQVLLYAPALTLGTLYDGAVGAAWALVISTAVTGMFNNWLVASIIGIGF